MTGWRAADGYLAGLLRAAIERALDRADCRPGVEVLDIGAGSQPYRALVEGRGARYVPCDLGPGPHTPVAAGEPLPFDRHRFAIGLSIQVLEHVWDLDWYLALFHENLRPDGRLILSTHGTWPYHPHPTDFRRWTRPGLCAELESRGFTVEEVVPLMGPLAWTTQVRLSGIAHVAHKAGRLLDWPLRIVFALGNAWMWLEDRLTPAALAADNACVYLLVCRPESHERSPRHPSHS